MDIREQIENDEINYLNQYAVKSKYSKGRIIYEKPCKIRTCFQRDRDRIIHSKSFRRLMHKTQVFISPEQDHYRTRLTHTLEVSQIARTIAKALKLNEDLTEAIALGHDLGHTPFGHLGEDDLNNIMPNGFKHNEQSIRVVEKIEKNGKGLNLTQEVKDGILNHRTSGNPFTLEGKVVQISDKIAYINHDIDDAIRADILKQNDLPKNCVKILGLTSSDRINFLINNIINNSIDKNDIVIDKIVKKSMYELRTFLFNTVYLSNKLETERKKYKIFLSEIYKYYINHLEDIPSEYINIYKSGEKKETVICDYIAGMTDRFALKVYETIKK